MGPLAAGAEDVGECLGLVGHDAVCAHVEYLFHLFGVVNDPDVDVDSCGVAAVDECLGGDGNAALAEWDLDCVEGCSGADEF